LKKTEPLVVAAFVCLSVAAAGQTVKDTLEVSRQAVESQRRILVAGALPLTDAEADAFWPLFDAYEKERRPLDERANTLVADLLARAATLTDAQAKAMVEEALQIDEDRLKVRRAYLTRMAKAVPGRKLGRFYQIDNKLDSVVRADIAKQIPLAP
jgi:Spy/CpxP family protein refolding chaperone